LDCHESPIAFQLIAEVRPCAVILDINMPEVDGIDIFNRLRSDPVTRAIPVIFLTANEDPLWERVPNFETQGAHLVSKLNLECLPDHVRALLTCPARDDRPAICPQLHAGSQRDDTVW
jgi:CheY-like chemotaxis protein